MRHAPSRQRPTNKFSPPQLTPRHTPRKPPAPKDDKGQNNFYFASFAHHKSHDELLVFPGCGNYPKGVLAPGPPTVRLRRPNRGLKQGGGWRSAVNIRTGKEEKRRREKEEERKRGEFNFVIVTYSFLLRLGSGCIARLLRCLQSLDRSAYAISPRKFVIRYYFPFLVCQDTTRFCGPNDTAHNPHLTRM